MPPHAQETAPGRRKFWAWARSGGDSPARLLAPFRAILLGVAYLGNLICRDCGLTFTSRWGSFDGADEYRCTNDHVIHVEPATGTILAIDGSPDPLAARTLVQLKGLCPQCSAELATGLLPACPVCGGRDHQVLLAGTLG